MGGRLSYVFGSECPLKANGHPALGTGPTGMHGMGEVHLQGRRLLDHGQAASGMLTDLGLLTHILLGSDFLLDTKGKGVRPMLPHPRTGVTQVEGEGGSRILGNLTMGDKK